MEPWPAPAPAPEKSSELYIRDHPQRSIAIVSDSRALILRYSSSATEGSRHGSHASLPPTKPRGGTSNAEATIAKCMVEFSPKSDRLLNDYRRLTSRPIFGTLGLIAVNGEVFLSAITHAVRAATVRPGETVERIASVAFYCLSSDDYDDVVPLDSLEPDTSDSASVYSVNSPYGPALSRREVHMEHPCHELRKLLGNGSFYYSTDFDVTNRLQDRPISSNSFDIDNFDDTYLWNSFMISPLVQFRSRLMPQEREALDSSRILTSAIRGFCRTMTLTPNASPLRGPKNSGKASLLTLISRLSCRRAGTRFNSRGIDDDGHVANFVETETTFWSPMGIIFSYAQVRGSVPVFWEQAADLIPGRQKITVTRSAEGTQPAFNKHFEDLELIYGAVHVINLLSGTKPAEAELSGMYRNGIRHCPLSRAGVDGTADHALLRETHYDFHAETKGPAGYEAARDIRRYIENSTDGFAYFLAQESSDGNGIGNGDLGHDMGMGARMVVVLQQEGVFRTNCLDCLDRTNLIQTLISQMAVEAFLGHRGDFAASDFWMRHSSLWADNGDSLSKIYAGTGALKSSFTRHGKMSLAGAVADMRKSVQRIYHNNFVDPSRQVVIDMLLGRLMGQAAVRLLDPISDYVSVEVAKRSGEYASFETITLWTGTFNLNGRTDGIDEDLSPWLFPAALGPDGQPDIYVVAFQEIVELSPQQIMNSDPSRKHLWERSVMRQLNQRQASLAGDKYVLLRSGQLVGAALCVFVKTSVLGKIKNVEGSVKKTGLSGMAGNKGAVAIRFDYASTPICLVTAHMAAGFANYDERNRDYDTIHNGLRFQRNRGIEDHEAIIWLGDFNYRIGLGAETARALIKKRDLEALFENDQLNLQMVAGLAFPYYSEARIGFMPTYKFDIGTENYDSSEKARIPAWTDRILRKGAHIRQLSYDSAPLRFSDHRPVYATFECRVSIVNEALRESISKELYQRRKAEVGNATTLASDGQDSDEDEDDEDLIGYEAIEAGLPPASSERRKWWLDQMQPARARMTVPEGPNGQAMALNPQRASNPFVASDEPDWVAVARASPVPSLSSVSSSPYEKVAAPQQVRAATRKPVPAAGLHLHEGSPSLASSPSASSRTPQAPQPPPSRRQGKLGSRSSGGDGGGLETLETPLSTGWQSLATAKPQLPLGASIIPQSTNMSTSTSTRHAKSPPPPVARKPAHLTAAPSPMTDDGQPPLALPGRRRVTTDRGHQDHYSHHVEEPQTTGPRAGAEARPAGASSGEGPGMGARGRAGADDQARDRAAAGIRGGGGVGGSGGMGSRQGRDGMTAAAAAAVAEAARARTRTRTRTRAPADLLGAAEESGDEMSGWETLQPTTRAG